MTDEVDDLLQQAGKETGIGGKAVTRLVKGFKAKGREGKAFVDTLMLMTAAVKLSQLAEKSYWDAGHNKIKSNADFDRAEELADRGIKLLDKAMVDFPSTISTLQPVRKKLELQLIDVRHQRQGQTLSVEELEAEYNAHHHPDTAIG
jgi:hypothetical protein